MKMRKSWIVALLFTVLLCLPMTVKAEEANQEDTNQEGISTEELAPTVIEMLDDKENEPAVLTVQFTAEEKVKIIPVTLDSSGCLQLNLTEEKDKIYLYANANLYQDPECTKKVGYSVLLECGTGSKVKDIEIPEAGKYYLKLEISRKSGVTEPLSFSVSAPFISSADRTLTKGKVYLTYSSYVDKEVIYKLKTDKTGYIRFAVASEDNTTGGSAKFTLLDSKKKALTKEETIYAPKKEDGTYGDAVETYALKKGTYYVKVSNSLGVQGVGWNFKEVKDNGGTSLKKAKALKLGGAAVSGLCLISDSKSAKDWYKFTLTKEKEVTITIKAQVCGSVVVKVCDAKGKPLIFGTKTLQNGDSEIVLQSNGKWSKGTYTISIDKDGKSTSSVYYTVKVK